ncbi:MAG: AGCS family alanine or glycine:cation symporter [Saprospiraceae bacterium]|jgi:AGCS family alanine or glycine:cation symporter
MQSIDSSINELLRPYSEGLRDFILHEISVFGVTFPWIVMWLIIAAFFFTFYFNFLNIRGFAHAYRLIRGDYSAPHHDGEITHFQALCTALSGTVGIGNIGGVAIVITIGGPGAMFWLMVAGFVSMSTKFAECVLGVMYRKVHEDGSVSGGPMYYLEYGLKERGLGFIAKPMGFFYAIAMVIGCLGIGNMFQSNQAFEQFVYITGQEGSYFADKGWLFGLFIGMAVAIVIFGGIKSIARVTSRLVPFMAVLYILFGVIIVLMNYQNIPGAVSSVFTNAFAPKAIGGGMIGVMILGFQRAVFSNEAGIGSAPIAHSAVKTSEPITEGFVGLLEPFIDTVVICGLTAMVILTTVYEPGMTGGGVQGVELTSQAFASTISWSVIPLSLVAVLFAYSTIISWSYYGLKGWTYIFGHGTIVESIFKIIFCLFVVLGCMIQLDAVLDFSDAMVFLVALPNVIGLYIMAPIIKLELKSYQRRLKDGSIPSFRK